MNLQQENITRWPVLPMWQPWASLVVNKNPETGKAWKQIETRPNKCPKTILGKTVLIYACRKWTPELRDICLAEPFRSAIEGIKNFLYGEIIGSVDIIAHGKISGSYFTRPSVVDVIGGHRINILEPEHSFGNYTDQDPMRWGWVLDNPRLLAEPIPFKGSQGINYIETDKELIFL